jgi:hypothetical protein
VLFFSGSIGYVNSVVDRVAVVANAVLTAVPPLLPTAAATTKNANVNRTAVVVIMELFLLRLRIISLQVPSTNIMDKRHSSLDWANDKSQTYRECHCCVIVTLDWKLLEIRDPQGHSLEESTYML